MKSRFFWFCLQFRRSSTIPQHVSALSCTSRHNSLNTIIILIITVGGVFQFVEHLVFINLDPNTCSTDRIQTRFLPLSAPKVQMMWRTAGWGRGRRGGGGLLCCNVAFFHSAWKSSWWGGEKKEEVVFVTRQPFLSSSRLSSLSLLPLPPSPASSSAGNVAGFEIFYKTL